MRGLWSCRSPKGVLAQNRARRLRVSRPFPGRWALLGFLLCGPVVAGYPASMEYRGANFVVYQQPDGFDGLSRAAIADLAGMGADSVALVAIWSMQTGTSVTVEKGTDSPSDDCLRDAIAFARSVGLRVILKPHVDCKDGPPRTQIAPSDADAWWTSYRAFLMHYAGIASSTGCELLCIGTELSSMQDDGDQWRSLAQAVRASGYSGKLTYAANWDAYGSVDFVDALDCVGVDAYFELSSLADPTAAELAAAWRPYVDQLGAWQAVHGKPLLITEVGYRPCEACAAQP